MGAILIALFGGGRDKLTRYLAAIFTAVPMIIALAIFIGFDRSPAARYDAV